LTTSAKISSRAIGCAALGVVVLVGGTWCDAARADVDSIEPLWHVATPPDARQVVADENGTVVAAFRGEVWTTDPIGGSQWHGDVATGDEIVTEAPAIDESLVVVPVDELQVVALDRSTGTEHWRQSVDGVLAVAVGDAPSGKAVAIVTATGVSLHSAVDGSPLWPANATVAMGDLAAPPRAWIVDGRLVVAWSDEVSHLRAFDPATGAVVWERDEGDWSTAPAVTDDAVYFALNRRLTPDRKDVISSAVRLELQTGTVVWTRRLRGWFLPTFAAAVHGSTLVVVDYPGRATALAASNGSVRWRRSTARKQFENETLVMGDAVAFTTYGTGLVALSRATGAPLSNEVPGPAQGWAIIDDSAATGDQLYLLARRTGLPSDAEGELWMLPGGPEGPIPPGWPK
jgi:outer membrane protein assembly factor BamB